MRTGTSGRAAAASATNGRRTVAGKRDRAHAASARQRRADTPMRTADGGSEIPRQVPEAVGTTWKEASQKAAAAASASGDRDVEDGEPATARHRRLVLAHSRRVIAEANRVDTRVGGPISFTGLSGPRVSCSAPGTFRARVAMTREGAGPPLMR